MRTTLTLESDVAQRIRQKMRQEGLTLKRVINDALRIGLAEKDTGPTGKPAVEPNSRNPEGSLDLEKVNQLMDELESDGT